MATITQQCNGSRGQYFAIEMTYTENSYSIENNTSNITIIGKIKSTSGYYSYYGYNNTGTIKINGSQVATATSSTKVDTGGVTLVTYNNTAYPHNADGTLSLNIQFDFSTTYGNLSDTSVSVNNWSLTTIPRASSVSATNANIGSASTITISPKASGFTHTLTYKFAGQNSETTIVNKTSNTSVSFTLPQSLYSLIPNSTSIAGTIYCYTYKNNNQVGDKTSVNITGNAVFNDCKPNITNYTYIVDASSAELADSTTFIKNVTTATIRIWAERRQYSTLKLVGLYYVENGQIKSIVTQAINTTSGTFELQLSPSQVRAGVYVGVQDSRGYIHYEGTIPSRVVDYVSLTADTSAQISRTNQTEAKVKITQFKGNYWNGNFRTNNPNTLEIKWRYAETTGTYSPYYTIPSSNITITNNTYTISNYVLTDGTTEELFDYQKAYYIEFRVIDKVTQEYPPDKYSVYTITAGQPNFAVFPNHVLFNGNYVNKLQADLAFNEANYGFTESDWNNAPDQKGKYMGSNKTNSPTARTTSGWWYVDQHRHLDSYKKQIAYAFNNDNNNIYVRDKSGGTWSKWDAIKTETTMHYNPDMPSTGVWTRVCRIVFNEHVQGEFCYVRIYIAPGQNGYNDQNAYIDLVMQLGWTGSNYGRLGCNAELHAFNSVFTLSNTNIKVIANSNLDYYVWVYTGYAYNRVNYTANSGVNCNIWDAFTTQSTEPTGTACNLEYRNNGMAVGSINGGADRYVKYDSGFMECYGTFSASVNVTSAFGNGYFYEFTSYHNYAQTFTWTPVLNVNVYATSGLYTFSINGNTTTGFKGYVWTCRSTSNQALTIHYHATGFWK